VDDVAKWYESVKQWKKAVGSEPATAAAIVPPAGNPMPGPTTTAGQGNLAGLPPAPGADPGPSGPGWIVKITGHHYHNSDTQLGAKFVTDTLIKSLMTGEIKLPTGEKDPKTGGPKLESVTLKDLGISYPVLVKPGGIVRETIPNPHPIMAGEEAGGNAPANMPRGRTDEPPAKPTDTIQVNTFHFVVHFCWQPTLASNRHAAKQDQKTTVAGN
jgi:type IV pilus assembly protein PilM